MGNKLAHEWVRTPRGRLASEDFIREWGEQQQAFESFAKEMIKFWRNK